MRLDKMLSNLGYGSRKEIRKMAKKGEIIVNGKGITKADMHIDTENDRVYVNGEKAVYREYIYIMLNKPQGVVSATSDYRDETVIDLIDESFWAFEPFPVGRLDKDTEGLLLLTNDGKLSHNLLSPKKHVDKTYYVEVCDELKEEDVIKFSKGVTIDGDYKCLPAELEILESGEISKAYVTIREGKFHQIKKMMLAIGNEVVYLKRMQMGSLKLDEHLELGEYRELSEEELELLKG
ncbi:MAG: rRNA pseudouridine synthase [Tissierellales bacterium]|jgi:16S rRNA pseudouridine516 synthase|nr:rRNA pseudouridine synthase [Tissierellales bacterium]